MKKLAKFRLCCVFVAVLLLPLSVKASEMTAIEFYKDIKAEPMLNFYVIGLKHGALFERLAIRDERGWECVYGLSNKTIVDSLGLYWENENIKPNEDFKFALMNTIRRLCPYQAPKEYWNFVKKVSK